MVSSPSTTDGLGVAHLYDSLCLFTELVSPSSTHSEPLYIPREYPPLPFFCVVGTLSWVSDALLRWFPSGPESTHPLHVPGLLAPVTETLPSGIMDVQAVHLVSARTVQRLL